MEFRGIMGGFYRISEWIMRLSVINLLWIICSIPFVLVIFTTLQTPMEKPADLYPALVLLGVVAPFTLFPATAAMFVVARKWVTGNEDAPLLKTFFGGYKENYLKSMLGGFFFDLVAVVLFVNLQFYKTQSGVLGYLSFLFIAFLVVMFVAFFHFFSIMANFHMKLWQVFKNAFLLTIGNPIRSIFIIATNVAVIWISFTKITFLIPFFMGSIIAYLSYWNFNHIFQKLLRKQEELREREEAEHQQALEEGQAERTSES